MTDSNRFRETNIDEEFLMSDDDRFDTWKLTSNDINDYTNKNAFIGNGYIGQRIPPEGEGSSFTSEKINVCNSSETSTGCLIHGLWGDEGLLEVPRWCGLRYSDGNYRYSRETGNHDNYSQTLDLKKAILTTKDSWSTYCNGSKSYKKTDIETKIFISRNIKNLGVISTKIKSNFSGQVYFEDTLSGNDISNGNDWKLKASDEMYLNVKLGELEREVHLTSRLILENIEKPKYIYEKKDKEV